MAIAALLSHWSNVGGKSFKPILLSRAAIQVISHNVIAITLYSASTLDRAITVCFFDFQEIGELPRRMQKPVVDR